LSIDFLPGEVPCRPLHGDLNPGNVLVGERGPVFLDFEDVFHSVLPPSFELAYALERFVMVPLPDDAAALTAGRILVRGYRLHGGDPIPADPTAVLRALALRALCALAAGQRKGLAVQPDEWRKFFGLESAARARAATLAGIVEQAP
jgi:Ser/Thr protein kinase RdoA (MazF antagonist)